jgi:acetolactate synthase-1/2/3 large subunit
VSTAQQTSTSTKTITGADILIEALVRNGGDMIFAYPGGASMPLHQALTRRKDRIRTILPRHEQGGGFAAQGVSRTTDHVGLCMATSGPGATNLVTSIADAKMDSVPLIAITGQVPQAVIGTDAFQETPIVEICRAVTKHYYMITADDYTDPASVREALESIPRIVKEAYFVANSGRPGPVLIDFPKNIQLASMPEDELDYDPAMKLPGYRPLQRKVAPEQIRQAVAAIRRAKKPILYVGGGVINADASEELTAFALKTGIPVTTTVMGIGAFPGNHEQSLHMLGMHGTVYANMAIDEADLLLALGVRFDDRVTGKLDEFALHGKIIHVDIDASEIHKNKEAHIPVVADVKDFLVALNAALSEDDCPKIDDWRTQCSDWKEKFPLKHTQSDDLIYPQAAIQELWQQTKDLDTYVAVGVGQHQMWAAQYYKFSKPKRWLSSSGLGTMGFGLPAAMGVAAAHPEALVIDIDGDGSVMMNIQELATLFCEKLNVKVFLLNNQHLGMVMQWEDRFMEGNRAHTYLGPIDDKMAVGQGDGTFGETFPNFVKMAESMGLGSRQVSKKGDLPAAIEEMINYDGPYLLEMICPYQEHVLPMIPGGGTVRDIINE